MVWGAFRGGGGHRVAFPSPRKFLRLSPSHSARLANSYVCILQNLNLGSSLPLKKLYGFVSLCHTSLNLVCCCCCCLFVCLSGYIPVTHSTSPSLLHVHTTSHQTPHSNISHELLTFTLIPHTLLTHTHLTHTSHSSLNPHTRQRKVLVVHQEVGVVQWGDQAEEVGVVVVVVEVGVQ